jgi:hypothetical protein
VRAARVVSSSPPSPLILDCCDITPAAEDTAADKAAIPAYNGNSAEENMEGSTTRNWLPELRAFLVDRLFWRMPGEKAFPVDTRNGTASRQESFIVALFALL